MASPNHHPLIVHRSPAFYGLIVSFQVLASWVHVPMSDTLAYPPMRPVMVLLAGPRPTNLTMQVDLLVLKDHQADIMEVIACRQGNYKNVCVVGAWNCVVDSSVMYENLYESVHS